MKPVPDWSSLRRWLTILILLACSSACTLSLLPWPATSTAPDAAPTVFSPPPTPQPAVSLTLRVTLPAPLAPGETLVLSVVDEVTGLALNATNYPMQAQDALHYTLSIPCPLNSLLQYRYVRWGKLPVVEDTAADLPVRYRLYHAVAPAEIEDIVASWSDTPFSGPLGRISGQVTDAVSGAPLTNILVTAGGVQTLTDSQGNFLLEGLPPGTHNLVAYALDGAYTIFQQGATVAAGLRTPAPLRLTPRPLVNVMFVVNVPANTVKNAPVRLAGNLLQLGNTFGDLNGGLSLLAKRLPALSPLPDGRYMLTLALPVGADVRYKYTLGDGFWNAEHRFDGHFVLRQLIVPATNTVVTDTVETWQAGNSAPIIFEVTAPKTTPATDTVSIQFNPYGWTEPIPMWSLGNNRWAYVLFSPLNMLGQFEYRYCRNEQCGAADDIATPNGRRGRIAATSLTRQDLQDEITAWQWMQSASYTVTLFPGVQPRSGFLAGVEFQRAYHPSWQPYLPSSLLEVQNLGANLLVLTPTWTTPRASPLLFVPTPASDPLWSEVGQAVGLARAVNLNVALFPEPRFLNDAASWWLAIPGDEAWWNRWFERYRAFVIYHADLARQSGATMLILGGEWLQPALPGGALPDGRPSGVPADADGRWRDILSAARQHFHGPVYWALPFRGAPIQTPAFLREADGIYLLWYPPLSTSATPTVEDMAAQAGHLLDEQVAPVVNSLNKPLILAVAYPSITGAARANVAWQTFNQPMADDPSFALNLTAQADIYQALLAALNSREWIKGFVSQGYYPPVALQDKSASVRGKPAAEVLRYWYPRLRGVAP